MSLRLGPAISSTFCGFRLDRLFICGIRRRHARNVFAQPDFTRVCVYVRSKTAAQASSNCRTCRRGVRFLSRAMDKERKAEGYSISQADANGADQPTSSSLLPHVPPQAKVKGLAIRFCPRCGGATEEKIPTGEYEMRFVCTKCGAIHYQNPKMVVGCLVEHDGKVLLCKRSIQPSHGLWTLPAGYMEMGESAAEGAARETREEACADVQVLGLFSHIDIPFIGQSYIIFRAQLKEPHFAPGPETLECTLFNLNEIPFDSLAFSSIHVALSMYVEDVKSGKLRVHHAVIDKRPGSSPSDLNAFVARDMLTS